MEDAQPHTHAKGQTGELPQLQNLFPIDLRSPRSESLSPFSVNSVSSDSSVRKLPSDDYESADVSVSPPSRSLSDCSPPVANACDRCFSKKVRCKAVEGHQCLKCRQKNLKCTFERLKNSKTKKLKKSDSSENKFEKFHIRKELLPKKTVSELSIMETTTSIPYLPILSAIQPNNHPEAARVNEVFHSNLIYPTAILDQLIFAFFPSAYWPINVIHPRLFIDSRYTRPRSLLYAICCSSCRLLDDGKFFKKDGRKMASEFFQTSLNHLNEKESSLDYVCALILLKDFALATADVANVFKICNLLSIFAQNHLMQIDPDNEIFEERGKWNLIEKESFRRAFWSLRFIIIDNDPLLTTTHPPLCDNAWYQLPSMFRKLPLSFMHLRDNPEDLKMKYNCEHSEFLGRIQSIIIRGVASNMTNYSELQRESNGILIELQEWGRKITIVFPILITPVTSDDWNRVYMHIVLRSLVLLNSRLAMVYFVTQKLQEQEMGLTLNLMHQIKVIFKPCIAAKDDLMNILNTIMIRVDSFELSRMPQLAVCLIQTCFFLGILSWFGDSDDIHMKAIFEYASVKQHFKSLGNAQKLSNGMLNELEKIERLGWKVDLKRLGLFFIWNLRTDVVAHAKEQTL
ncbi:hypothetical protein HK096_008765 [Nowakowskiella sp. JEL0078]|nr:hypothetical protein HK096_008765 [Nowakowskiella sp. JEL0078]